VQVKAVREEYLRNVYYFKRPDLKSADSKGTAFRRLLEKALNDQALCAGEINGEAAMVWLP
jgi:hypothetical protein